MIHLERSDPTSKISTVRTPPSHDMVCGNTACVDVRVLDFCAMVNNRYQQTRSETCRPLDRPRNSGDGRSEIVERGVGEEWLCGEVGERNNKTWMHVLPVAEVLLTSNKPDATEGSIDIPKMMKVHLLDSVGIPTLWTEGRLSDSGHRVEGHP